MAEYIDRKKLMDDISKYSIENYSGLIRSVVMKQPAADVAPVVHGKWLVNPRRKYDYICSACGCDAPEDRYRNYATLTAYCPCRGAKMDGGTP